MSTKRIQIIGGFPQSDWNQTDKTKTDYIKNKITKVSELENDSGYLTEHQDISDIVDAINEIDERIPTCDATNNGQFLRVVNGVATWTTIPNAEDNTF